MHIYIPERLQIFLILSHLPSPLDNCQFSVIHRGQTTKGQTLLPQLSRTCFPGTVIILRS